jgi:two-component system nitrate/nitrite response regulator NarL
MKVIVVSPVRLFSEGLALVLRSTEPLPDVTSESSIAGLHRLPRDRQPDVVLIDVTQGVMPEEVSSVATKWPNVALVALGLQERRDEVVRLGSVGFVGFVARDASVEDLQSAMLDAVEGRMRCSPDVGGRLVRALFSRFRPSTDSQIDPTLTRREGEVLSMIGRGLSNKEIARELALSEATVKCHVHHVLAKLGVCQRSHAMRKVRVEPWIVNRL